MTVISVDQKLQTSKPPKVTRTKKPNPAAPDSVWIEWGAFRIGMEPSEAQQLVEALTAVL